MAVNTDPRLQNQIIYSIYVRNHTPEGTFRAVIGDLDRIRALGTDIIWLMPIHPIGVQGKKGTMGCPYANRDYRSVTPEYGTMEDFQELVRQIHARGMKCMIDVVYNHTSPDSVLYAEHPEYFYHNKEGKPGNKVGDWADVIDLDYTNRELWQYLTDTLIMWAKLVDGFRCDVASFVPLEFWQQARRAVAKVNPDCIWLAETVHQSYGCMARRMGIYSALDFDEFSAFDLDPLRTYYGLLSRRRGDLHQSVRTIRRFRGTNSLYGSGAYGKHPVDDSFQLYASCPMRGSDPYIL